MSTTMGMGIGTNTEHADRGRLTGVLTPVACSVWFTSTGRVMPRLIKYEDENGCLQSLTNFRILHQEEKYYCGISMIEYECDIELAEQKVLFHLLFYIEQKEWKLWWKHKTPPK